MAWHKLKNIILIILLLANAFLLVLVVGQDLQSRKYEESALADALQILKENGIVLSSRDLPAGPLPKPLRCAVTPESQQELAVSLLGEGANLQTQTALLSRYLSPSGVLELRADGGFSATFSVGAAPLGLDSPEHHALALVKKMGLAAQIVPNRALPPDGTTAVTLRQTVDGKPIFSQEFTALYRDGSLAALSGNALFGPLSPDPDAATLSLATLLVRFRAGIAESGAVCRAVVAITPGYITEGAALVPILQMESDTGGLYALNALTGALSVVK
ncbi:MAG: hypothetical protein RSB55_07120 [Oscillospiraceae bacterium]